MAIWSLPAFAAIEDDTGLDDQFLDNVLLVALEGRSGRLVDERNDFLVGDDQLRHSEAGKLEGPGATTGNCEMGSSESSTDLGVLTNDLQPARF